MVMDRKCPTDKVKSQLHSQVLSVLTDNRHSGLIAIISLLSAKRIQQITEYVWRNRTQIPKHDAMAVVACIKYLNRDKPTYLLTTPQYLNARICR